MTRISRMGYSDLAQDSERVEKGWAGEDLNLPGVLLALKCAISWLSPCRIWELPRPHIPTIKLATQHVTSRFIVTSSPICIFKRAVNPNKTPATRSATLHCSRSVCARCTKCSLSAEPRTVSVLEMGSRFLSFQMFQYRIQRRARLPSTVQQIPGEMLFIGSWVGALVLRHVVIVEDPLALVSGR